MISSLHRDLTLAATLAAAALILCASPVHAGTLQYDYDAANDTAGNGAWENEASGTPARNWTFDVNPSSPITASSSGTTITSAYDFEGGLTTDPTSATATTFDGSALDPTTTTSPVATAFEFWLKPDTSGHNQVIFESGGTTRGVSLLLESTGATLRFATIGDTPATDATLALGSLPTDFIQVVGVVDTVAGQTRLYVNGEVADATDGTKSWNRGTDGAGLADVSNSIGGLTPTDQTTFLTGGLSGTDVSYDGQIARARFYSGNTTARDVYDQFIELAPSQADAYADAVLADSPIAYWRLDEPAGQTTAVNTGSLGSAVAGTHDTTAGTITLGTAGLVTGGSTSADFAPATATTGPFIAIPNNAAINTSGNYSNKTIELWFNADTVPTGTANADVDMLYEQGGGGNGMNIFLRDGKLVVGRWGNGSDDFAATTFDINAGQTYHVVATIDTSTDELVGYLDGAKFAVDTDINALATHTGRIAIGAVDNDTKTQGGTITGVPSSNHFDGTIDEVSLYNSTLTLTDIQTHYVAGGGDLGVTSDATLGVTLNYDGSETTSAVSNAAWDDSIGTVPVTGSLDWTMSGTGVTREGVIVAGSDVSAHPGIDSTYVFDGVDDGTMGDLQSGVFGDPTNDSATFEFWIRPDDFADNDLIFETGGSVDGSAFTMTGSVVEFRAQDGNNTNELTASFDLNNLDLTAGNLDPLTDFSQVVAVVDFDDEELRLYVNGRLRDTVSAAGKTWLDWGGTDDSGLAGITGSTNADVASLGNYEGDISILRFYESELTNDQIRQNYLAVSGFFVPEPGSLLLLAGLGATLLSARRRRRS